MDRAVRFTPTLCKQCVSIKNCKYASVRTWKSHKEGLDNQFKCDKFKAKV